MRTCECWVLRRDGSFEGHFVSETDAWRCLLNRHVYSVDHALHYEGYSLKREPAERMGGAS